MYKVIPQTFFQKKTCLLPGIGKLDLITTLAEYQSGYNTITAPQQKIVFTRSENSGGINSGLTEISEKLLKHLTEKGKVVIEGLGIFTKDISGNINFEPINLPEEFYQSVVADRVTHKKAEHRVLIGDKEIVKQHHTEDDSLPLEETVVEAHTKKEVWWLWPLLIASVALAVIAYYLYANGLDNFSSRSFF